MVAFSARFGVRSLQAAAGLTTMIFTSLGYIKFTTGQLSSASAVFTTVAAYSALLCGVYFAVFVELLQKTNGPKLWMQRGLDALLTAALVLAGILHATTDAVKYCDNYNAMFEGYHGSGLFRCGSMSIAIVLTFATAGLSLVALVLSFIRRPTETATEEQQQTEVADFDAHRPALKFTRRTSRVLQFICALVAMITTVAGYKHYYTGQYTSPAATFAILATYTSMVYGLWHITAVETLKLSSRPALSAERAIDAVLAVGLLVAGIIFVSSAQVEDCKANNEEFESYHGSTLFRCGNMNLGVVFTFITVLMLAATFGLSFLYGSNSEDPFSLARASKDRSAIRFIRLGGRSLQTVCAIVGMIFTSTSYIKFTSGQLSSASAIFTTVACYTAMLVGLYHAVFVEMLQKTRGPKIWLQRGIDLVVAVMLGIAGSLHAASNAVRFCDDYNAMFEGYHGSGLFRCGSMSVSIAMAYVTMAISLILLALSFIRGGTNTPTLQEEPAVNDFHALHTPVVKPGDVSGGAQVQLERPALRMTRRTSRVLQFAFSLVAMITTVAGYKHYYTGQYTSPAATFAILATYTGMLYGLWHITAVETLKLSSRPKVSVERLVDGVLAVALLVAGIIFVTSSQVEDCESSNKEFAKYHGTTLFRCGTMNLGVFFSFVSVAVFLVTFTLSFFYPSSLGDGDSDATSDVQESVRVSHAPSDPSTAV